MCETAKIVKIASLCVVFLRKNRHLRSVIYIT